LLDLMMDRIAAVLPAAHRSDTTVVLVGRGSSDPDANAEHAKVARLLWEGRGFAGVEPAFISLAEPGVPAALDRARLLGARRIVVAPYFLFPGVLPSRVVQQATAWSARTGIDVRCTEVIGAVPRLADLVVERWQEALHGDIRMNCDTCLYRISLPGHERRVGAPQRPHHHPDDPAAGHSHEHPHLPTVGNLPR
jgi:sirohydrochlorin cobaltochelatase